MGSIISSCSGVGGMEVTLLKFVCGEPTIIRLSGESEPLYSLLLLIYLIFLILAVVKFRQISACRLKHNANRTLKANILRQVLQRGDQQMILLLCVTFQSNEAFQGHTTVRCRRGLPETLALIAG